MHRHLQRSERLALPLTAILSTALVALGCTRLDNPNDTFGNQAATGGSSSVIGSGGETSQGGSAGDTSTAGRAEMASGIAGASWSTNSGGKGQGTAIGQAGAAGGGGESCWDPFGFNGLGCYRCTPKDIVSFEGACTHAACSPFDNRRRLSKLDVNGGLPALPAATMGGGVGGAAGTSSLGSATSGGAKGGGGATSVAGSHSGIAGSPQVASSGSYCEQLTAAGKLVYVAGSSAAKPFLQQVAQQIVNQGVYLVYVSTGSCVGVDAIVNRTPMRTGPLPLPATAATYWDSPSSAGKSCDLPADGVAIDIGISDVFAQTCPGFELASIEAQQIKDAHGPVQTMAFVVPATSKYSEISAQAAYLVFGFGSDGAVLDPGLVQPIWNDESYLFVRSASSGTQAMLAAAIGVPPSVWKGKPHSSSDAVAASLQSALNSAETGDKAIGILAADYIDSKNLRAQMRVLGFQDTNQACAFYPDSMPTARDKRNVRDGHYPLWSPLHLLHRIDSSGAPVSVSARQEISDILGYLSGTKALPSGIRLMDVFAQSGLVPECAMRVTRTQYGGNLVPFSPSNPCSCLFEQTATGTTSCTRCTVQGDCGVGQNCSLGFCEG